MHEEFLESLDSTVASLREWDPSPILIPLSIDLQSEPITIDILDTLGAGKNIWMESEK